jgi:hypothetical protein
VDKDRDGHGQRRTWTETDKDRDGHKQGLRLIGTRTQTGRDMIRDTDRQGP